MRLREFVFGTAFMSLALVTVAAAPIPDNSCVAGIGDEMWPWATGDIKPNSEAHSSVPSTVVPIPALPSPMIIEDRIVGSAYYDVLGILMASNSCSDFFGGSPVSLDVFNSFMGRVKKDHLPVTIGMRMSGPITSVVNTSTKTAYRLFDRVSINANGPFYRGTASKSEPTIPHIGRFSPNSREVRVLMLLHELGHLIKGAEGNWLLPDDGNDTELSIANSQKIDDVCGDQIRELGRSVASRKHSKQAQPQEALARVSTDPEPKY